MKRIILSLMLAVASISTYAQAGSLTINNNLGCDVYLRVFGDVNPSCNPIASSSFIVIAAGTIGFTYTDPSTVPGLPLGPTDYINGAEVYTSIPSCASFATHQVGEPCSGWVGASPNYFLYNPSCTLCWAAFVTATWTPAGSPGGNAVLDFN